ncbi:Tir chaperone protein (CesT) family protein [Succinivibrio dextrinosolvens]|uniref:type III secretion system chaperone n=1 Tax=Succinivibrio dextrinosolvens TaxID=83771 RepID=UPI0008E66EDD|nr:type III secretion system chaperone [Succinivibrio dextrinosolvens]SFS49465.1 Tir chaperone protein (CesT) family protein [Succinivibrio dextrinosolvens]
MNGAELIRQLGQKIGIDDLSFSNDNNCGVLFDEDDVLFELTNGNLFIAAEIGHVENSERAKFFEIFMSSNHLGQGAALGSIGFDAERDMFTLTRVLPENMDYNKFEEALVIFIRALRQLKSKLQDGVDTSDENQNSFSILKGFS